MDALTVVRRVAARQDSVVTLAQARAAGLTVHEVHRLCRAGRWRTVARGAYLVDADLHDGVPRRARIRAAVASFGPGAAAVLATAAELYDIAGVQRSEEIHVSVPGIAARPVRPNDPQVTLHQLAIEPTQLGEVAGIAATVPVRTVADLILRLPRYPAVCLVDSALNQRLVRDEDLPAIHRLIRGRRGAVAARGYLAEADCRAQSPLETRTRLRCVDGRVPPDVLQMEVRDHDGSLLGIGDLGWRRHRIIAEADGKGSHSAPAAVFADRRRQNRLLNAGWAVLRFTWADTLQAEYIPWIVRQAMQMAAERGRP
ncbi:type IV toxin-antitoxin system AbiEi family antitoxin domain-containing protein [Verrucosispora sp. WMMA2044]|uniref:type IV toxin-antitoxin system AbiEi family antitoxin domain-containing protein n=1 Tax=Verrucosispora sp. WMMA2044 TaxID=3016419 RepID=UPI00248B81CD|nr:type IV toxin-antitoxin system AbiEi family antitoxin domain-containing protein [Verrucosispora sp. WMMA2044]WBB48173.1 type IV toxin-antitoxin system AbiEi family antitoxin domain-containing protein [Verrucosispora sp. WMMA2044]